MAEATCYLESFPHVLPHQEEPKLRPCGHWACEPHTITYYGTGEADDKPEGEYCMVCYAKTFPNLCPDPLLRRALAEAAQTG